MKSLRDALEAGESIWRLVPAVWVPATGTGSWGISEDGHPSEHGGDQEGFLEEMDLAQPWNMNRR